MLSAPGGMARSPTTAGHPADRSATAHHAAGVIEEQRVLQVLESQPLQRVCVIDHEMPGQVAAAQYFFLFAIMDQRQWLCPRRPLLAEPRLRLHCIVHPALQLYDVIERQQGGPEKSKPAGFVADGQFQPKCLGSELSRQIAVDLESDADLDEGRGCPGHWPFPSVFMNTARYIGSRSESNLRGAPTRTTAPRPRSGAATAPGLLQRKRDRTTVGEQLYGGETMAQSRQLRAPRVPRPPPLLQVERARSIPATHSIADRCLLRTRPACPQREARDQTKDHR
jgi:hypothetical protein